MAIVATPYDAEAIEGRIDQEARRTGFVRRHFHSNHLHQPLPLGGIFYIAWETTPRVVRADPPARLTWRENGDGSLVYVIELPSEMVPSVCALQDTPDGVAVRCRRGLRP